MNIMESQNGNANIEDSNIKEPNNKKEEIYEIKKEKAVLGKGAFGTVYLGTKINSDGKIEKVALKEIPKQLNDEESQKALQNEIDICQKLDNTNIVKMIKIEKNIDDKIYLVYELCNGGDLRRYMDYFKTFDEELIQIIVIQMVNALFELHKKDVVHHDIKPENILIQLFPDEDMTQEIEKKIDEIKEITSKKHKPKKIEDKNKDSNFNQNKANEQNIQNNNNAYQKHNSFNQNNNNSYYQNNNNSYYQNNNNTYYQNNNFFMNNNMNQGPYNNNMNYNFPMNYNQGYPPMLYNQFNNNPNNFYGNNNFNGNNYHPYNNLNPNFNNFQNNNMNNQIPNNLLAIRSRTFNPAINNNANKLNNNNQNNNNQNNQSNNKKEHSIDKSEILKILKKARFKLSDFGLSKLKSEKDKKEGVHDDGNRSGSPLYMSPELFLLETTMRTVESQKVDIWALGILAFEMFFGRRPFEAYSIEALSKMYRVGEYYINLQGSNNEISKEFVEFLNLCLQNISKDRADVFYLQKTDFYNTDYKCLEKLKDQELFDSLESPERDEKNNILIRIDKKYYKQGNEENTQQ